MKIAFFATIVLALICTAGAVAQDQHDPQVTSHRVTKTSVRGYVRKDGDNYVVEDDKDKTRYRVQNSEVVLSLIHISNTNEKKLKQNPIAKQIK